MTALSDLIARLEAAKAGSRELDAEIWCLDQPLYFAQDGKINRRDNIAEPPSEFRQHIF